MFDNATGVGRKICGGVRTTETFAAFAAHYGFEFGFCNPNSGHEKGNVERKVYFIRQNLFVPVLRLARVESYNEKLLGRCLGLAKEYYRKGVREDGLFGEDRAALAGLPEKPFEMVRYVDCKSDKQGKVQIDGRHWYSADPSLAGERLIAGLGATRLSIYTSAGEYVCSHERQYGAAPTDSASPASQLPLLAMKLGAWRNSSVRSAMPDALRDYMDGLGRCELGDGLRLMRDQVQQSGWDATVGAMQCALARRLYVSNDTIDWFLSSSNAAQLRAVSELIEHEMAVREEAKRARLFRRAKFPQVKSFEGYDFSQVAFPDGYGVDDLKSLSFVEAAQDFVFHGQTGRGKTHLAIAVGHACVMAGKAVRFYTAAELALALSKARREHGLEAMMKDIAKNDLVILDEFGYVPLDTESARLLFQVVSSCYERRSMVFTTNIEFSK